MLGLGGRQNLKQIFVTDLPARSFTMLKSSSHRLKAHEDKQNKNTIFEIKQKLSTILKV